MNRTVVYGNNIKIAYADFGHPQGFPILIQHGLIASIRDQHLFYRLVEAGARLISIARPGYGESSPYIMRNIGEWGEIAGALVDELRIKQFDVLGISSGAPYSYAIGCRLANQVRNLFILSGTPALYDEEVLSFWPYPVNKNASLAELQDLAFELFFAHLSEADLERDDTKDSLINRCFGIAQDIKLRCADWGFQLEDIKNRVVMRHSRADSSVPLITAQLTAKLLPNCVLQVREQDAHFSQEVLDDFICTAMVGEDAV